LATRHALLTNIRAKNNLSYFGVNGVFSCSDVAISSAIINLNFFICTMNSSGTPSTRTANIIPFAEVGGAFTQPDLRNIYTIIVTNFLAKIGAN
jgi:hypothetical protein